MYTQETREPTTRINKSQEFALALISWLTIRNALEEAKILPEAMKAQVEETIYQAMLQHPNPAEA
jgi:hypothetical protein